MRLPDMLAALRTLLAPSTELRGVSSNPNPPPTALPRPGGTLNPLERQFRLLVNRRTGQSVDPSLFFHFLRFRGIPPAVPINDRRGVVSPLPLMPPQDSQFSPLHALATASRHASRRDKSGRLFRLVQLLARQGRIVR